MQNYTSEELEEGGLAQNCAIAVVQLIDADPRIGHDDNITLAVLGMAVFAALSRIQAKGGVTVKDGASKFCSLVEHISADVASQKILDNLSRH